MNVKLRVKNLTKQFGTKNPFKLAEYLKIEIIYADLGDIKGFYKTILRRKFIFINSKMTELEQRIVCGHELGHACLHSSRTMQFMLDHTRITRKSKIEQEANEFAAYLLEGVLENEYIQQKDLNLDIEILEEIRGYLG